jgi:hypothetical protein
MQTKVIVLKMKPKMKMIRPEGKLRARIYDIVEHKKFEIFILTMVVLNALVMAVRWLGMSDSWKNTTEYTNYAFSVIFLIEAILKLTAYPC